MHKFPRNALFMATMLACASLAHAEEAAKPADGAAAAAPAAPKGPTLGDIFTNSGIEVKGYVDVVAEGANFASPLSGSTGALGNPFAVNNFEKSNLGLHQLSITVDKLPKEGAGGLITLTVGSDANYVHSYTGSSPTDYFDVTQAYAQYAVGDWTYQLGKFATLVGVEVVDSTANTNISRSMGFGLYPYTHTGIRATKSLSETSNFIIGVNNGWDQITDSNTQKTIELGYNWSKADKSLVLNISAYAGTEPINNTGNSTTVPNYGINVPSAFQGERDVLDINLTKVFSDKLTGVLDLTYASQSIPTTSFTSTHQTNTRMQWYTVAGYLNYQINETKRLSFRAETFVDKQGYKSDLAYGVTTFAGSFITVNSLTATYGYLVDPALELRAEVRFDRANMPGALANTGLFTTNFGAGTVTNNAASGSIEAVYKF